MKMTAARCTRAGKSLPDTSRQSWCPATGEAAVSLLRSQEEIDGSCHQRMIPCQKLNILARKRTVRDRR